MRVQRVFAALAHRTRREVLLVLRFRGGSMSAGEIAQRFACRWPTVTRHLHVLERAGLIRARRKGRARIYRLNLGELRSTVAGWERWFAPMPKRTPAAARRV